MPKLIHIRFAAVIIFASQAAYATGADQGRPVLVLHAHSFMPARISIPAGTRVAVTVRNEDATPEEFDSSELRRETVVQGGQEATIYLGPLPRGTYSFVGEFHSDTAHGEVVVQ